MTGNRSRTRLFAGALRVTDHASRPSIDPIAFARQACRPPSFPTAVNKKATKDAPTGAPDLEKSLAELEKIVARMESGDLSLDESLKQFERGVALTRQCQAALRAAEQKVEILLRKSGSGELLTADFDADDATDAAQDENA